MSLIHVPQLINVSANARNNCYPSAWMHRQLVDATNHTARYRRKCLYARTWALGVDDSSSGTDTIARFRCRTGYYADSVGVLVLTLPTADRGGWSGAGPRCEVDLTISGGATTTLTFATGIVTGTPDDGPDDTTLVEQGAAITANTVYECAVRVIDYGRIAAILVYELGESQNVNTASPVAGSPIYDADRETLAVSLSRMHERNGGISSHWSLKDGTARTRTSATPINLINGTSTGTPTAGAHPGVYLDCRYHNRRRSTTVPFEFACYASQSSGTGVVRLIDTAGNVYGSCSVTSATPGWVVATANLPTAETYYAPQFYSDGAGTLSVYATSLAESG